MKIEAEVRVADYERDNSLVKGVVARDLLEKLMEAGHVKFQVIRDQETHSAVVKAYVFLDDHNH